MAINEPLMDSQFINDISITSTVNLNDNLKISIVTFGSRGDVQPYIALGLGLKSRGHIVTIVTEKRMEPLVKEFDLSYSSILGDSIGILFEPSYQKALRDGSIFTLMKATEDWEKKFNKRDVLNSYIDACNGADVIISGALSMTITYCVAEMMNVPWIPVILGPTVPTSEFPIWLLKSVIFFSCMNKWSYRLLFWLLWNQEKKFINPWRREVLKLDDIKYSNGLSDILENVKAPIIISYSSSICPNERVPSDYPSYVYMKGFVFVPNTDESLIDTKVIQFLSKDPSAIDNNSTRPIIYLGFGSMPAPDPNELIQITIDTCKLAKCRAVLVAGWSQLDENDESNKVITQLNELKDNGTILVLKSIPHDWLFPRVHCIVHHCGIGTTAAAFRAGIPQLPCPFMLDQPSNAAIVVSKGCAPGIVPYDKYISAKKLSNQLIKIFNNNIYQTKAKLLGEIIRKESETSLQEYSQVIEDYVVSYNNK